MASRAKEREEFLYTIGQEGLPLHVARLVARHGATLHRLAEAQCNGDWPCDNGERKVEPCSRCGSGWVPSVLFKGGLCPDCRTEDRVRELVAPYGMEPVFQGDPRGCVLKLRVPSGKTNDGGHEGICVL